MDLSELVAGARTGGPWPAVLDDAARARLEDGARRLAEAAAGGAVYGLTTGVGALKDQVVGADAEQALRLWRSHAGGFGPELDDDEARLTMAVRLRQLAAGPSAVSVPLAEALESALRSGAVPVLHGYGGIGTADLTVLAELGLALAGEGAWRHGRPEPVSPRASDGLPFLSSSARTTALAALARTDLGGLLHAIERVAAASFRSLRGNAEAYDVPSSRDPATARAAARIAALVADAGPPARLQDPFALRTVPQVHGVAEAELERLGAAVHGELVSSENPLPTDRGPRHHGGFLTQRLAAALDGVRTAVVAVADLSQARTAALMDQRLTGGAAFGTDGTPGSSGLMVLEYVAADLAARLRALAVPATLTRTSVSLGLEEVASHATQSALLARQQAALLPDLLACELVAAEGAGRPDRVLGPELEHARSRVRDWAREPVQPIGG